MKRAFAFLTFAVGILAVAPVSASAAELVQGINITITKGGVNRSFNSTPVDLFDGSLGTLQNVTESVTGSIVWDPGSAPPETKLIVELGQQPGNADQVFTSPAGGGSSVIQVDLGGPTFLPGFFEGKGTLQESLTFFQISGGPNAPADATLSEATLIGTITYIYVPVSATPPSVPEPSTWAMMLVGCAGLGYAAVRRRGAVHTVSA